ncbi:hypothetical protein NKW45_00645 [Acetobacter orientalis]|uniref:hypothetical protein n=1 Tax=Acetobacter orientalis TaxID=146474 RepID=UPI0020A2A026|nr:hypothetical protein [Acetobacter orientalis]MCP1220356.1 hypothetical protein [Acetobacter orientalis]
MIVKETRIKVSSGYKALADHMLRGDKNEVLLVCEGSEYWLKDWVKEAKREGLTYGLLHISFNPEQTLNCQSLSTGSVRNFEQIKRLVPLSFTKKTVFRTLNAVWSMLVVLGLIV